MKHLLPILLLPLAFAAHAQTADRCPQLPKHSGATWQFTRGPDFGVCYAMKGKQQLFGVYLGGAPSFRPSADGQLGAGQVGGRPVVWYKTDDFAAHPLDRQALLTLPNGAKAHIWITADSAKELQERLGLLRLIHFK